MHLKLHKLGSSLLVCVALLTASCESFLDEKPNRQLTVPTTLEDLQALLDNFSILTSNPAAGEAGSDDYFLSDANWASLAQDYHKRLYTWEKDYLFPLGGSAASDWSDTYRRAFTANSVLEEIKGIPATASNQGTQDHIRGQAHLVRGRSFLAAAVVWTPAYDPATAATDLGIPLRLGTDFNEISVRSTVEETYAQIIRDLEAAARLLPDRPLHPIRGSRPAAYGLLARTYLAMRQYGQAGLYADSCLQLQSTLLDYNTLNSRVTYPVPEFNAEVIHDSTIPTIQPLNNSRARVDTVLYSSYAADDLRKTIFFQATPDGYYRFRGSYTGSVSLFGGIATDEVYLMRAEAYARQGKVAEAMHDLNTLLEMRWKVGTFVPFTAASSQEALVLILQERRKELLLRGLRWMDLKRLNKEGAGLTLTRVLQGQTFTLSPNDLRYALPIPEDVIDYTGMQQNPR